MALVQVLPAEDDWNVVVDGNQEGDTYDDQTDAESAGRSRAKELGTEFQLHGRDGTIREKDSYGNDPRDVPG